MTDETVKEIMKMCDDSYKQGAKDAIDSLVEALRITVKMFPNMTVEETIQAINQFDYNKKPVRSN